MFSMISSGLMGPIRDSVRGDGLLEKRTEKINKRNQDFINASISFMKILPESLHISSKILAYLRPPHSPL